MENLNDEELKKIEAEIKYRRDKTNPTFQHHGDVGDLSASEISNMENEIKARRSEVNQTFQHHGSVENLNASEISSMENEIKARRNEVNQTFQHYGSVENLNDNDIHILEAQAAEKRDQDIPYKEYFNNLISNPVISDNKQFEDAVMRSMQSNGIMKGFTSSLVEKISEVTYAFKSIEKTDIVNINIQKQKLESLVNVYERYLYELKKHDWTFYGEGNDIGLEMISSEMLEDLWQIQKQFGLTFSMPIPKDLGEKYGKAFEREGQMVPAIRLMYDDLKNKEVNWYQVLNKLTPDKEKLTKEFDLARREEMEKTLNYVHTQKQENNNIVKENDTSIRR